MSPSFLASRDKLGQLKKKPSFPISTNRDETWKKNGNNNFADNDDNKQLQTKRNTLTQRTHVNRKKTSLLWVTAGRL